MVHQTKYSAIVKLKNSQVLYKTKDGLFNITDGDDIEFISYDISKRKRKTKKARVVCMFINGQREYYNAYKINKNNWIKLKKDFGAIYKVYIYNIKNVRYFGRKNIM